MGRGARHYCKSREMGSYELTPSQAKVAAYRAQGLSYPQIAEKMGKGVKAIQWLAYRVLEKRRLMTADEENDTTPGCPRCGLRDVKLTKHEPTPHVCLPARATDYLCQVEPMIPVSSE